MSKSTRHRRPCATITAPRLRRFLHDEEGAAYTLSFVMTMPIYALLMCLIIEAALLMTAKLGTVYAAFAAARSATVWSSATSWEKAQKKAEKAAIHSMVPFASGTQSFFSSVPTDTSAYEDFPSYWFAYQAFAKDTADEKYLMSKYGYAYRNVEVTIDGPPKTSDSPITAKVTYKFPFNVPGIGRLLGKRRQDGYYYELASEVTIPNEGPRDNRKTIGIGYGILE